MSDSSISSPTPEQDSQIFSFLLATFFLLMPIVVLLILAWRGQTSMSEVRSPWDDFNRGVRLAEQPGTAPPSPPLVTVNLDQPIKVVTWTRGADAYKNKDRAPDYKDTWVTVVPYLKKFCQEFVKSHGADPAQLSRRLEQRLGLRPNSDYSTFVELIVNPKDISNFFRPCGDPSPAAKSCQPASALSAKELHEDFEATDPKKRREVENRFWFLNAYYGSFALSKQYPWTSLGYTFDWAATSDGQELTRFGESEFVIPAGAPIQYVSDTPTASYCASP